MQTGIAVVAAVDTGLILSEIRLQMQKEQRTNDILELQQKLADMAAAQFKKDSLPKDLSIQIDQQQQMNERDKKYMNLKVTNTDGITIKIRMLKQSYPKKVAEMYETALAAINL